MTITYPLTLPTSNSSDIAEVTFTMRNVVGLSESPFSYIQQTYLHAGARWEMYVRLNPLERAGAAAWRAWLASLRGRYGTFLMGDPTGAQARGAPKNAIVANSGQSGSVLSIVSSASVAGFFLPGDYVQLGVAGSARLHRVLSTVTTSSNGFGLIDIWPPLRSIPSSGDTVVVQSTVGVWRLAANDVTEALVSPGLYQLEFSGVEAL